MEKGAVFCGRGDLSSNAIPLRDEMVVQIQSGGKRYALYAEAIRPGDGIFLPYYLEERTDYTIGRNPDSHIHYENRTVSWDHARLHWDRDGWRRAPGQGAKAISVSASILRILGVWNWTRPAPLLTATNPGPIKR